jgi:hypothetical protein
MRRPDAGSEDDRRQHEPSPAAARLAGARARENAERRIRREQADRSGQQNQPEIVLVGDTPVNAKHPQLWSDAGKDRVKIYEPSG